MDGFLVDQRTGTLVVLFLAGITIVTAGMTRYVTNQEIVNQLTLQLFRMTLGDQPRVSPYTKFHSNYFRVSVCSLKIPQKLEMCDMLLGDDRYQYLRPRQFRPDLSCIRVEIQVASAVTYTKAFKCPTPERTVLSVFPKPSLLFTTTVSYLISSAAEANAVTLYYKYPGIRTKIRPDMTVLNLPMKHLKMLIKEERKKPYVKNKNLSGRLMYHEIAPQRNYDWTSITVRNPPTAENEVFFFERSIKKNAWTYRKFQAAWGLTHICGYTSLQLAYLCWQMMNSDSFGFESRHDFETSNRCQRRVLYFPHSESGPPRIIFHLVQCHLTGLINKNSYFISTSAVHGKVLLHVQYNPHEEIIPEGYKPVELKDIDTLRT